MSMTAISANSYTIRFCKTFDDFNQCIELQRKVWNIGDLEITPSRIYVISQNAGGFLLGAFTPENRLIGFLHTFPAFGEDRSLIYYSHMMAVEPELQNIGLGRELKLRQCQHAIENNIQQIIWTFDPLRSRNAYFNINKLGCIVRRYKVNFYGADNGSIFDAGIESDRLMAEWWVNSRHANAALNNKPLKIPTDAPFIEVPVEYTTVRSRSLAEAQEWRLRVREQFQYLFKHGLVCTGFERGNGEQMSRYYFTEWQQESKK
jgi:predicted GNAT superfamily acetyltransferase